MAKGYKTPGLCVLDGSLLLVMHHHLGTTLITRTSYEIQCQAITDV